MRGLRPLAGKCESARMRSPLGRVRSIVGRLGELWGGLIDMPVIQSTHPGLHLDC